MFTGLVEETGKIISVRNNTNGLDITICANKIFDDLKIGDSVAINGCCQTVTEINNKQFTVQAVIETVNLTNFKYFKINDEVNIERALKLSDRLGGHIVSGHVEATGQIQSITNSGNSTIFTIGTNENIKKYIIHKGSITINGVSLTVCDVYDNTFTVSVIPHTLINTTFNKLKLNDIVNLETDIIAKYVEKLMFKDDNTNSKITMEFLRENGF